MLAQTIQPKKEAKTEFTDYWLLIYSLKSTTVCNRMQLEVGSCKKIDSAFFNMKLYYEEWKVLIIPSGQASLSHSERRFTVCDVGALLEMRKKFSYHLLSNEFCHVIKCVFSDLKRLIAVSQLHEICKEPETWNYLKKQAPKNNLIFYV